MSDGIFSGYLFWSQYRNYCVSFLYSITQEADWTVVRVSFVLKFISWMNAGQWEAFFPDLWKFPVSWKENDNFALSLYKPP